MSKNYFVKALAILLTVTLIAPVAFFAAPPRAHALFSTVKEIGANLFTNIKTTVESTIVAIEQTIGTASNITGDLASVAMQIDAYVLQPLAFVLSGNLMKALTASVISFVIGKANSTGVPQFVVDVQMSLQTVADSQALAFFNQFGRNSNSPFAGSITSALRNNYLQKTSLAGFWAANMDTLARSSPNVRSYLAGNWSQGGVAAWFALTTRTENNPYMLYQASQSQLSGLIGPGAGGVTGTRLSQLSWGQGFMSWCGATEESTTADNDGTEMEGVNPGDACTDPVTGAPGTIKTPGSTIKATLDKVLGGQQDQIVRMGNVGPQINQILGNIATVMNTVNFAAELLGGPKSGGLFGIDSPSGTNSTSRLAQFANTPGALGVTYANVYQDALLLSVSGSDKEKLIVQYESSWNNIGLAANTAQTNVGKLSAFCTAAAEAAITAVPENPTFAAAATVQAAEAETALKTEIAPVFAQAAAVGPKIAPTKAMILKIKNELATASTSSTYSEDILKLQTMPPTAEDVAKAMQDEQAFGGAEASPPGSLTLLVNGATLVDQMNLLSVNAVTLETSVCTLNAYAAY